MHYSRLLGFIREKDMKNPRLTAARAKTYQLIHRDSYDFGLRRFRRSR